MHGAVWQRALPGGYALSDEPARLDLDVVHHYLAEQSYWAAGRPRAATERAIANCLCLGLYAPDGSQAGFARVLTDYTVRAHIADVFVLAAHRGRGLGVALIGGVLDHPAVAEVDVWTLTTRDAHGLYGRFGFVVHPEPATQMVMHRSRNGENGVSGDDFSSPAG